MESLSSPQICPSVNLSIDALESISFAELSKFFHVPLIDAAKAIGICPTALKRACRKNNIPRWPHRKIKSLDKAIECARAELDNESDESVREKLNFDLIYFQQQRDYVMRGHYGSNSPKSAKRNAPSTAAAAAILSAAHKTTKKSRSISLPQIEKSHRFSSPLRTACSDGSDSDSDISLDEESGSGDELKKSPKQTALSQGQVPASIFSRRPLPVSASSNFSSPRPNNSAEPPVTEQQSLSSAQFLLRSSTVVSSSLLTRNGFSLPEAASVNTGNVQFPHSKFALPIQQSQQQTFNNLTDNQRDVIRHSPPGSSCFGSFKMNNDTLSSPVPSANIHCFQTTFSLPPSNSQIDWKFEASPLQTTSSSSSSSSSSPSGMPASPWEERNCSMPSPTKISFIVNNDNTMRNDQQSDSSSPCHLPPINSQFMWFSKQELQQQQQQQQQQQLSGPIQDNSSQRNLSSSSQSDSWFCHPRPSYELKRSGPSPFFLF